MSDVIVTSFNSMGIRQNFSGMVNADVEKITSPQELFALQKTRLAESHMGALADTFIKQDDTELDLAPGKGKVMRVYLPGDEPDRQVAVILNYNPETKKPIEMKAEDNKNSMKMLGQWDESGKMTYMMQNRSFDYRDERITETAFYDYDKDKGIIKYQEVVNFSPNR
jgi:hypothetical protein